MALRVCSSACRSTPKSLSFVNATDTDNTDKAACCRNVRLTPFVQDPLIERNLVPQHHAFIGRTTMALLHILQRILMMLDRCLELLDILGSTLAKSRLCLAIPLLALFRSCVDLRIGPSCQLTKLYHRDEINLMASGCRHTGLRPPLRFWTTACSCCVKCSTSGSDMESSELVDPGASKSGLGSVVIVSPDRIPMGPKIEDAGTADDPQRLPPATPRLPSPVGWERIGARTVASLETVSYLCRAGIDTWSRARFSLVSGVTTGRRV